jgi:hypothetical protein
MRFDELNKQNYLIFAIRNYENPQAVTQSDFLEDMRRFTYIKRLLKKYKNTGDLNINLLINHFIILYNVFGDAATPLLFFKIDRDYWCVLKTFIIFLQRLPEYPKTFVDSIQLDSTCLKALQEL